MFGVMLHLFIFTILKATATELNCISKINHKPVGEEGHQWEIPVMCFYKNILHPEIWTATMLLNKTKQNKNQRLDIASLFLTHLTDFVLLSLSNMQSPTVLSRVVNSKNQFSIAIQTC